MDLIDKIDPVDVIRQALNELHIIRQTLSEAQERGTYWRTRALEAEAIANQALTMGLEYAQNPLYIGDWPMTRYTTVTSTDHPTIPIVKAEPQCRCLRPVAPCLECMVGDHVSCAWKCQVVAFQHDTDPPPAMSSEQVGFEIEAFMRRTDPVYDPEAAALEREEQEDSDREDADRHETYFDELRP